MNGKSLEFPICDSLSLRYTTSISHSTTKYTGSGGFYNSARFYFYSAALKSKIGKDYRAEYSASTKGHSSSPPNVTIPDDKLIHKAIEVLITKNIGISVVQHKKCKVTDKAVTLNSNELFIFWLTEYSNIANLDNSSRTDEDRIKLFSRMVPFVGNFDLSRLCTADLNQLSEACDDLASLVKKSIGRRDEEVTSGTKNYVQIIRFAVSHYLSLKNINSSDAINRLINFSTPKQGIRAKVSQNMQLKTLPLEVYQHLYLKLAKKRTAKNIALLLMLFLGMSAEEVCGLNLEDMQPITGYSGCYHFQVIHQYKKHGSAYIMDALEDEDKYRYIPIPAMIWHNLNNFIKNRISDPPESPVFIVSGKRLTPKQITNSLNSLFNTTPDVINVQDHDRTKSINLSFDPSSYKRSCRAYWHYQCGLSDGEIRYLSGLKTRDTVSSHYIDFNNASMQYRLLMQLNYGIDMLDVKSELPVYVQPLVISKHKVSGRLTTRAGIEFIISEPSKFYLKSQRGIVITEGDAEPCLKI